MSSLGSELTWKQLASGLFKQHKMAAEARGQNWLWLLHLTTANYLDQTYLHTTIGTSSGHKHRSPALLLSVRRFNIIFSKRKVMKSNKTCEFDDQCGNVRDLTFDYAVWGKLLSRRLRKSSWLENYPVWVDAATMGEQLLSLLSTLQVECTQAVQGLPYLVLTRCDDGSPRWLCFRKLCPTQFHNWSIDQIERAVVHIYLAHASQMCQDRVHDINGKPLPLENRYILCPETLLDYLEGPKIAGKGLKDVIEEAMLPVNLVKPADGDYKYRREVLKWQTSLAVWRKHGEKHIESYFDLPPPYSEKKISSDYANHQSN